MIDPEDYIDIPSKIKKQKYPVSPINKSVLKWLCDQIIASRMKGSNLEPDEPIEFYTIEIQYKTRIPIHLIGRTLNELVKLGLLVGIKYPRFKPDGRCNTATIKTYTSYKTYTTSFDDNVAWHPKEQAWVYLNETWNEKKGDWRSGKEMVLVQAPYVRYRHRSGTRVFGHFGRLVKKRVSSIKLTSCGWNGVIYRPTNEKSLVEFGKQQGVINLDEIKQCPKCGADIKHWTKRNGSKRAEKHTSHMCNTSIIKQVMDI